ncbi:MAG: hypothetical protein EXR63_00370 [Dehalococcoidia bacterium]|nr:hypothetical protein [Dehalococcoidia bacterium]
MAAVRSMNRRGALLAGCALVTLLALGCGGDDGADAEPCWSVDATASGGDSADAGADRAASWVVSGAADAITRAVEAFLGRYQSGLSTLEGVALDDLKTPLRDANDALEQWKLDLFQGICDLDAPAEARLSVEPARSRAAAAMARP